MKENCHLLIHICEEGAESPFGDFSNSLQFSDLRIVEGKKLSLVVFLLFTHPIYCHSYQPLHKHVFHPEL